MEYRETSRDLQTRIEIHGRFGARDIDPWMIDVIRPGPGSAILDVGCGAGKQCRAFYEHLEGRAEIIGGDVSPELMAEARRVAGELGNGFSVQELDFNRPFPFSDERFDLVSCCFAIYYAADIPFTLREMHRVLRPGGGLFTTGPMPENKRLFYEIIEEATGRPIPPMPGSSRYASEILTAMRRQFSKVEVHIFENPLVFPDVGPFVAYTRASLSEDRKLWTGLFRAPEEFESVMRAVEAAAERRRQPDGKLIMTKIVGGFLAAK
ncbi:MAG: class I SAM-dependent methyltransferase [Anaerolineales bacterium]